MNVEISVSKAPEQSLPKDGKKERPAGTDTDRYRGLEDWPYKKWAWEFLRRNKSFQAACKRVNSKGSDEAKMLVAAEFGLKKYKFYRESYRGKSGKPVFSVGSVTSKSHLEGDLDKSRKFRVKLDGGQVLVRFDLNYAIAGPEVLKEQLRSTELRLNNLLKLYADSLKKQAKTKVSRHKVGVFGQYLRMLDLSASGKTQIDSELLISPTKARQVKDDRDRISKISLAPAVSKKMDRAIAYSTELYRYLAVLKGKPRVKAVPLEK
jgi:hypothetical protein